MKKILAVAIASAFAAPAFAATSNVDVYGSINLSYENVDDGTNDWNRMVTNNNSFIGFKGSEDLGGGMKAVWQLETNIQPDGSQSNAADAGVFYGTRNSFVGLSGGFGTVVAGTHDTPYKMSTGSLDIFVGTLGDYNAIFGNAAGNASSIFDLRTGNTIAYVSPNFGGFDVKAAYVSGLEAAEPAGQNTANAYSLSGTYANGPLFVTAAYETHNDVAGAAVTAQACNVGATCLGAGTLSRDAIKLGAGYKFGDLKLGAIYEKIDGDTGTAVAHDTWGLNAAYAIGAITLKASYATASDIENAVGVEVANTGADMWALGVDYSLSKRTTVQLTYANMDNDSAGSWDLGQGPQVVNTTAGQEVTGFGLGVKHTF